MKILWLGKRFYTNKDALSEHYGRMYQLPRKWQEAGVQVRLWLIDYHTRETLYTQDGDMLVASAPMVSFGTLHQLFRALITNRANYIVASGDCYIGMIGWILARLSGASFIFDIYDKYDVFAGYHRIGWFDPFGFLLKHADRLLFASRRLADTLRPRMRAPYQIVLNGVDLDVFKSMEMLACRRELGLSEDAIIIGYFGAMEPERGLADLIAAVALLRSQGKSVELLLAGKASPEIQLDSPEIHYLGMVPNRQVPLLLNACDILVIPYRHGPFIDMAASCKITEYLACRRPLVVTDTPNFMENYPQQAAMLGQALCRVSDPEDMARAFAYQFDARKILPLPENVSWDAIAANTLSWLRSGKPKVLKSVQK